MRAECQAENLHCHSQIQHCLGLFFAAVSSKIGRAVLLLVLVAKLGNLWLALRMSHFYSWPPLSVLQSQTQLQMQGEDQWCLLKGHFIFARKFWISWLSQDTWKSQFCTTWASLMLRDGLQEVGSSADSQLGFVVLTLSFIRKVYAGQRGPSQEDF